MKTRFVVPTFLLPLFTLACMAAGSALAADWKNLDEAIQKRGTLRIGLGFATPPMNFLNDQGEPDGFDADLARALAAKMGLRHEIIKVNDKTRITSLVSGETDMVLSNMNHTMSRDAQIDFSDTYLNDGKRILAEKGKYRELKDFVGKRIAISQGSNAQQAVAAALKKLGDPEPKVMSFQNNAECFLALKAGKVDGYTNDTIILAGVSGGDPAYEPVGEVYSPTYYGIGVPQNQSAWRDRVNAALRTMLIDGSYQKIYDKWFGEKGRYPLPPAPPLPIWAE